MHIREISKNDSKKVIIIKIPSVGKTNTKISLRHVAETRILFYPVIFFMKILFTQLNFFHTSIYRLHGLDF